MIVKKIVVGSTNPVKIGAVRDALGKLFPKAEFGGIEVGSGVAAQPKSDEETMQGARNRARRVLRKTKADIAIGLEGGVIETSEGMMNTVWCCLLTREGVMSLGGGSHFLLPKRLAKGIGEGREMAEVLDEMSGEKDVRSRQGAIGFLTKNLVTRRAEYAHLVRLAMVKLQRPELYT